METRPRSKQRTVGSRASRVPDHPSIRALMAEARPGEKAEDVMRRKCRNIVQSAKALGWSGPPFDPVILASINGVKVRPVSTIIGGEASITAYKGEVIIEYLPGGLLERERFTICHELAHTCFPDVFERRRYFGADIDDVAHKKFEHLCDVGASEFLMPHEDFEKDMKSSIVSLPLATRLQRRYCASVDATIRRIICLTEHPCAATFLTDIAFGEFKAVPNRFRAKFCAKSESFRNFIPSGVLVPVGSVAHDASENPDEEEASRETWWIRQRPYTYYVEALKLPVIANPDYPKIVVLLHARKQVQFV